MNTEPHILVVDDDGEIRSLLERFLRKHGFRVTLAQDGRTMRRVLAAWNVDLVVLDLMLPGGEGGVDLCRELRQRSNLPVIMLTAMGEETDRIVGLEVGADDYIAKPFSPRELLARIRAVLRRSAGSGARPTDPAREIVSFAGWTFDPTRHQLHAPDGVLVPLSAGECELLRAFVARPNRVLSRDQLLDLTRGRFAGPFDRSVDIQISRLRRKLRDNSKTPNLIRTVRGSGYILAAHVEYATLADPR